MEYSFYDFLKLIGSLGMFLYGMKVMSEGLQKVAGDRLRSILTAMTTNRVTGILTGVLITALIQSSSATTVMVVSFVNAGLLSLAQSITVIMGANVGTTVTAWIISIFGFKVSISSFAIPLIGLSIPLIFSGNSRRRSWGEFIVGFAFLFLGLDFLKGSVPDIQSNPAILFDRIYQLGVSIHLPFPAHRYGTHHCRTIVQCHHGHYPYHVQQRMDFFRHRRSHGIGRKHRNHHYRQYGRAFSQYLSQTCRFCPLPV